MSLCDRTWFYGKFKKRLNHEIDIEHLIKFFNGHSSVVMCGNNGDPIYHSKFHELCSKLKKINCTIRITTNGSGKKKNGGKNYVQYYLMMIVSFLASMDWKIQIICIGKMQNGIQS
jgi:organic radical activating enzyme